ncbi:hypothetical protein QQP08_006807 [Theobroma cacao]|nr:hypothetical protein QQP08_006807 [Theobroma cacao]
MGRIVLPLHAELWGILVEHVDEEVSITRALAESKSKFETSGSGEGVIGLEDARVEGGDQCDQEGEESIKIKGSVHGDQALDGVLSFLSRFCTATVIDVLL